MVVFYQAKNVGLTMLFNEIHYTVYRGALIDVVKLQFSMLYQFL